VSLGGEEMVSSSAATVPEPAIDAAVVSICGPVREENEDAAVVLTGEAGQVIAVVADGMGGHAAGRAAAEIVVRVSGEHLRRSCPGRWQEALAAAVAAAHEEVRAAASSGERAGMGATALLAVVDGVPLAPVLHLAHVGDSRAYLLRGRSLLRLTADHSLVEQLIHDGLLPADQASAHPDRNVLQRAIGQPARLVADVQQPLALDAGDRLLLVSDGIHGALVDAEIERVALASASAADACERLVEAALAAGSDDNASVVCLHVPARPQRGGRPTRPAGAARGAR
jgi:PPM family protein phosphatase